MFVPVGAINACEETKIFTTVLENGVTVESTIVVHNETSVFGRAQTKHASKSDVYKYNGSIIATVVLDVYFGYNGSTSWVNSSSSSHTVSPGWKYSGENIAHSGGTATLTATLKKTLIMTVDVYTTLSCSPSGTIS